MSTFALSQLPERFQINSVDARPQLAEYVLLKYGKDGYRRGTYIEYNPESKDYHYRWVENASNGLRFVGKAHEIVRMDHTGYYIDNFQDETVHGQVWQLPARNGEPQYIPAVNDTWNPDCSCVDFTSVASDKEDCAQTADEMARVWAEREREYQAKEDAKNRLEEIDAEIKETYQDFRRIVREIRASCDRVQGVAVVRELVKGKWADTKEQIHKLRREQKRIDDYGIEY